MTTDTYYIILLATFGFGSSFSILLVCILCYIWDPSKNKSK